MDAIIEQGNSACPGYNITTYIRRYYNNTLVSNTSQNLPAIFCLYSQYLSLIYLNAGTGMRLALFIGVCIGIISSILALITFWAKDFRTVSFLYHRIINGIELAYCLLAFLDDANWYVGGSEAAKTSLFWMIYITYIQNKLILSVPIMIELVIAWVAVDRALLCNSPTWFAKVNTKVVAWSVTVLSVVIPLILYFPGTLSTSYTYNITLNQYVSFRTQFSLSGQSALYSQIVGAVTYVEIIVLTPSAALTVYGLIQISNRKKKLISANSQSISAKNMMSQINTNNQLCIIQICESAPVVLTLILRCAMNIMSTQYQTDLNKITQMPLSQAKENVILMTSTLYLGIVLNFTYTFTHSTHYFRYLLFAKKVRDVTVKALSKTSFTTVNGTSCAPEAKA